MPNGPAVVIIARHGARLDAADKTWHLTSPTPYDPPLTYGGWTQSKALGKRIAALLHAREEAEDNGVGANGSSNGLDSLNFGAHDASSLNGKSPRTTKRKQKIVIHSSPFQRCVQSSIAISAGIAQFQPPSDSGSARSHSPKDKERHSPRPGSPKARAADSRSPPFLSSIPEPSVPDPEDDPALNIFRKSLRRKAPEKTELRIDAFLGEWLSPDYFENITPPPNSTMMVAGAKADLLRRGEYIEVPQNPHNSKGHFPGGWAKSGSHRSPDHTENAPLSSLSSLAQVLPLHSHNRSNSQGSVGSASSRTSHRGTTSLSTSHKVASNIYDAPIPTYAVSPSDPIPRGYVAHARDACVDVDYQWDSMRAPQEWGDGGEYGDEWSTMHKRFRKGLAGMIAWYKEHGTEDKTHEAISGDSSDDHDDDRDLVLVLVTHGAGCNALLGAISNQPVLLDVGMASLSMAVRKDSIAPKIKTPSPPLPDLRRSPVLDLGMSEDYEMKILASLDHLRPGVDPAKLSEIHSPPMLASPTEYRRRFNSFAAQSPGEYLFSAVEPIHGINSSLGSMRRSSTSNSSSRLFAPTSTQASATTGLWSRTPSNLDTMSNRSSSPGADLVLNFPESKPSNTLAKTVSNQSENDDVAPLPVGRSITGLWGPAPIAARNERVTGPKRRWTVSERDAS